MRVDIKVSRMIYPKVTIIILNWNGWQDTIECLESIFNINYKNYDVVVLDNGSKDESIDKIKKYAYGEIEVKSNFIQYDLTNKPINLIEDKDKYNINILTPRNLALNFKNKLILFENKNNDGFAEGNNIAIKYAMKVLNPQYILLLNNDTVVSPPFLTELVKVAETDEKIGIVGPTIYHYNNISKIQSAGCKILWNKGVTYSLKSNIVGTNKFNENYEVDYIHGCALLARTKLFKDIGYLNKKYFAYWEETDWCVRAKKAGFEILHVPRGKIWHKGSMSSNKIKGFQQYQLTRNRFWFMKTNANKTTYCIFLCYFFFYKMWHSILAYLFYYRSSEMCKCFLKGIRDGIINSGSEDQEDYIKGTI